MDHKYYLGYIRNPNEFANEYSDVRELEIIIERDNGELKELLTKAKLYPMKKNEVFDGHRIFESNASLIGRIERKLSVEEIKDYFHNLGIEGTKKYLDQVIRLNRITTKKALVAEEDYILANLQVLEDFQTDASTLVTPITFKKP